MISSRVRHNKTHPHGHHDVHARSTRDRRGKNRQNFYLQPLWRSSAVPVQPFMSRVGRVSDGTCTKRKMFDLPRTPNGGCVRCNRGRKTPRGLLLPSRGWKCGLGCSIAGSLPDLTAPSGRLRAPCPYLLAFACASRTGLRKALMLRQNGQVKSQNGSTEGK